MWYSEIERERDKKADEKKETLVFGKQQYILFGASVALIALGYTLMVLDNQIESFVSLTLSPIILITGYMLVIYAILKR